jgi:hypothetical protein
MIPVTNYYKLVPLALGVHFIQLYKLPQVNKYLEEILFMMLGFKETRLPITY